LPAMKWIKFAAVVLSLVAINSCKNELKLNAPYKEIPSIYAVLNPNDSRQIIRINKVFLGEGDANVMAQIADSINYPAGELTVTLNRYVGGQQVDASPGKRTITFTESEVQTNSGAFSKTQKVYITDDPLRQVDPSDNKLKAFGDYVLTVKNNRTGNIFTAKATAIDSIKGGIPPLTAPVYPYPLQPPQPLSSYVNYVGKSSVSFFPNNAILYQLTIRVHFYDSVPGGNYYKYVDYVLGNKNVKDVEVFNSTNSGLKYSFTKDEFFNAMGVGLSRMNLSDQVSGRRTYKIEYLIHSTTQDYIDYLQYVTPSLSISQAKPLYSNFDKQAALGLFTFRSRYTISKEMATEFVSEFARNSNTCKYQFVTAAGAKPGCK